jgi:hypothetical protein
MIRKESLVDIEITGKRPTSRYISTSFTGMDVPFVNLERQIVVSMNPRENSLYSLRNGKGVTSMLLPSTLYFLAQAANQREVQNHPHSLPVKFWLVVILVDRSSWDVESQILQLLKREHRTDRWELGSIKAIDVHAASVGAYKTVRSSCGELDREAERHDDGVVAQFILPVGDALATVLWSLSFSFIHSKEWSWRWKVLSSAEELVEREEEWYLCRK